MPTALSVFGIKPFRIGGQEAFARELSSQLGSRDWRSVLCFASDPPPAVLQYLESPNVAIEVLPDPDRADWQTLRALAKIVRRHRPTILHLHYTGFISPYPWLSRLLGVKKIFFTDHSSRPAEVDIRRAPLWKRVAARLINWPMTRVICVSDYGLHCATALGLLPATRYQRVYNAVDFQRIVPHPGAAARFRQKYSIPQERSIVLQVSWIIPEKGIEDLLRAMRRVIDQETGVQLVIVGEGSYREQFARLAVELGIGDHVTWTGLVEDPFGEGVYEAADVVCQVSRWEEVFGFVIAEAMAWGKPVVATKVGGIPELVEDLETGFVVPRGDVNAIADKILALLRDPGLRERFGQTGRSVAERKFHLKANVSELLRLYGAAHEVGVSA